MPIADPSRLDFWLGSNPVPSLVRYPSYCGVKPDLATTAFHLATSFSKRE
jgi:hypothetical protein